MSRKQTNIGQCCKALLAILLLFLDLSVAAQQSASNPQLAAARTALERNDLSQAEKSVWSMLSSNPSQTDALTLLGIIRGRQQRYAEAESLFKRVLELDPKSLLAYRYLGSALLAQDKLDEAVEQYKQAEKLAPQDPDLRVELARLYLGRGNFADALSTIEAIPRDRLPGSAVPVKAASLLGVGRASEAAALIDRARNSPPIAMDLADVFLAAHRPDDALKALNLAAPASRRLPARFYYLKGEALKAKQEFGPALAAYRQSLALDPKTIPSLLAMAETYAAQNKHDESLAALQRARALDPDSLPVLRHVVVEAMATGRNLIAKEAASDLIKKSPQNPDDKYLAAAVMLQQEEYRAATQLLEDYVRVRPNEPKAYLGLGISYLSQLRYPEARNALERALQLDPSLAEAEYELGLVYAKEGNTRQAVQHQERAVEIRPAHAKALFSLGTLYLESGELEKALSVLQRSAAADPSFAKTEYEIGLALSKLGRSQEAQLHMERYRELQEAEHQAAKNARKQLTPP
ncbi:MAG TPA: tetratricopeptide repeat protein [Terriglobales bacterium]|nr:tetratricopeptide repeat protein [Terriglobales bacterium]